MANRSFRQPLGHLEVDVVELFAELTIGATGAVTLTRGSGITSATRNSAGNYTLLLADAYHRFLGGSISVLDAADEDPNTVGVLSRFVSEDVDSAKTVVFQCFDVTDGGAADPGDGAKLFVSIKLRNSSAS